MTESGDDRPGPEPEPEDAVAGIRRAQATFSLSGGGFTYEDRVGAWLVAGMLAGRQPLGQRIGVPEEIAFQERPLGARLDDVAVVGSGGPRVRWRASLKSFTMLDDGRLPLDLVREAWADIDRAHAAGHGIGVVLICDTVPSGQWAALRGLLAAAREDGPDRLAARVTDPNGGGFVEIDTTRRLWDSARRPGGDAEHADSSRAELLSLLIARQLDFRYADSPAQDQAIGWCESALRGGASADPGGLWEALTAMVAATRNTGGSLTRAEVHKRLASRFTLDRRPDVAGDWDRLDTHTAVRQANVRGCLLDDVRLARQAEADRLTAASERASVVVMRGPSGCGKSALANAWLGESAGERLWLSGADLAVGPTGLAARLDIRVDVPEMLELGRLPIRVVLDGLDASFEPEAFQAAAVLMRAASTSEGTIRLVISCQTPEYRRVVAQLRAAGAPVPEEVVDMADLTEAELRDVLSAGPLRRLLGQQTLMDVLRRPKLLDVVLDALTQAPDRDPADLEDEASVATLWWEVLALGARGLRAVRAALLAALAETAADELRAGVEAARPGRLAAHLAVVDDLRADGVLADDEQLIAFSHDLFGDWSRLRLLTGPEAVNRITDKAALPTWHRAIRLAALRTLGERGADGWRQRFAELAGEGRQVAQDLWLEAPILARDAEQVLRELWPSLLSEQQPLAERLLRRFLHTATTPDARIATIHDLSPQLGSMAAASLRDPIWPLWPPMIAAMAQDPDASVAAAPVQAAAIADTWLRRTPPGTVGREQAVQLALATGRLLTGPLDHRLDDDDHKALWRAFLAAGGDQPQVVCDFVLAGLEEIERDL